MRRILTSLLVIAAAVSIAAVGLSGAWFSDVEESKGSFDSPQNMVAAGVMELDPLVGISETITLEPCDTGYGYLLLHLREDSSPAKAFLHIKNIENTGGDHPEAEEECDPDDTINAIEDWLTLDLRVWQDVYKNPKVFTEGEEEWLGTLIHEDEEVKLSCAECFWIPLGITMEPCTYYWVEFSFHLQGETPNCYQGDKCKFDINVLATETAADDPDDLFPVAEMKTVRLEDKTGDPDWDIIWDNDTYGVVNYWVGGDLHIKLVAKGLAPGALYQMKLQGPGGCTGTDHRLASGVQGHGGTFDAGYWTGAGALKTTCSGVGMGIYNFGYECADGNGDITKTFVIKTGVGNPWPALPAGTYNNVEMLVVRVQPHPGTCVEPITLPWPGTYTGILMGTGVNLGFTIP